MPKKKYDPTPGMSENRPPRKPRKRLYQKFEPEPYLEPEPRYSWSPASPTNDFIYGKKATRYKRRG